MGSKKPGSRKRLASTPIIIWTELWDEFNAWHEQRRDDPCSECGRRKTFDPEWDEQQSKKEKMN